jgi:hypothetical protein
MSAFVEAAREQGACMNCYPMAALERTMKIQEVILRWPKKITWWQAAEIIGIRNRRGAVREAADCRVVSNCDLPVRDGFHGLDD